MDTDILDSINLVQLGSELQDARKKAGLTQEDIAKLLDVARTTVTAIEKGERRIKHSELVKLARAYKVPVSDFVRPRPRVPSFRDAVQYRGPIFRSKEEEEAMAPYLDVLQGWCRDYLELEQIMEEPLNRKYPLEYPLVGLPVDQAAESVALQERNRLGLGDGPIASLRDVLEEDVGIRVFYMEFPPKFSGVYIYTEEVGACIAVNKKHPEERRRWTMGHDYAHFLTSRHKAIISINNLYQRIPESERFADEFSPRFLMPTGGLMRRFTDMRRQKPKMTLGDLCTLAHVYGASVQALIRRLEDLRLLKAGYADDLQRNGFKVNAAMKQLGLVPTPARDDQFPLRYKYLAFEALRQERIGEEQFARFMHVDRLEARRLVCAMRDQQNELPDDMFDPDSGTAAQP